MNKSKETPTASSSLKMPENSSYTESAGMEPKAAEENEASEEGSSGNTRGEDEEEVNDHDQEEEDDDVLYTEERPSKKAKTVTRSSRRGNEPTTSAKELVKKKDLVVPKRLDYALLERLRVKEDVKRLFQGIGWGKFLEWDTTVYALLVKEFYGDLDIDHNKGVPEGIQFTLLGEQREFTVDELNKALKKVMLMEAKAASYKGAIKVIPNHPDSKWSEIWSKLIRRVDSKFKSCDAKETTLKDPAMQMCHRILSYNLYGKKDSSTTVSKGESYILWAMQERISL